MLNKDLLSKKIGDYIFFNYTVFGQLNTDLRYYINERYKITDVVNKNRTFKSNFYANIDKIIFIDFNTSEPSFTEIVNFLEKNSILNIKIFNKKGISQVFDLIYLIKNNLYIDNLERFNSYFFSLIEDLKIYINIHNNVPFKENSFFKEKLFYNEMKHFFMKDKILSYNFLELYQTELQKSDKYFHVLKEKNNLFKIPDKIYYEIKLFINDKSNLENFIVLENKNLFNIFKYYLTDKDSDGNIIIDKDSDGNIIIDNLYKLLITKFGLDNANLLMYSYILCFTTKSIMDYVLLSSDSEEYDNLNYKKFKVNNYELFKIEDKFILNNLNISSLLLTKNDILDANIVITNLYKNLDLTKLSFQDSIILLDYTLKYSYFNDYIHYFSDDKLDSIIYIIYKYDINGRNNYLEIDEFKIHDINFNNLLPKIFKHLFSNQQYLTKINDIEKVLSLFSQLDYHNYHINVGQCCKEINLIENIFAIKGILIEDYISSCNEEWILNILCKTVKNIDNYINKIKDKKNIINKFNLLYKRSNFIYTSKMCKLLFSGIISDYDENIKNIFLKRIKDEPLLENETIIFNREIYQLIKKYGILPNI